MASSSSTPSPLKLQLAKRPRLQTDWEKCLICQRANNEKLVFAQDQGLKTLCNIIGEKQDHVFTRISHELSNITDLQDKAVNYHRTCYKQYTKRLTLDSNKLLLDADISLQGNRA